MEAKPRTSRVAMAHKEIYLDDTLTGLHEVGIPCDQSPPRKLKAQEFPRGLGDQRVDLSISKTVFGSRMGSL